MPKMADLWGREGRRGEREKEREIRNCVSELPFLITFLFTLAGPFGDLRLDVCFSVFLVPMWINGPLQTFVLDVLWGRNCVFFCSLASD